ncbi:glycosyltransferase family 2 protein [Chelativorans sp. AA-79]|uniref:glycosyltransferase family 2 protein n=1 Tax=Chelativorans sp. AA-79 TaxID=3028735 RepID=UPI0023F71FA6|nr:glycosyltransferase family 2 protein [Chelativorans sp. AA-79]WEX08166.1 glycosyltransferase family 2 protein [Chelativorans sp. AA-79]
MTDHWPPSCLIIIPCLNEAAHIGPLLELLQPSARRLHARIVVVDGGSTDGTPEIVAGYARENPAVLLLENKKRLQSAAVNLAVKLLGDGVDYFIRIDAHGKYPDDYCDRLLEEAVATQADSVVVSMETVGSGLIQRAAAAAQNSKLGTGGSRHRHHTSGEWIDHGHHALMRIAAFRAVGGYDESFSHNEDAELDHRLRQAGYRIWLTARTRMTYFPRSTFRGLYLQYLGYGRGRARNILKHRVVPKLRQTAPLLILPLAALATSSFLHWILAVPFLCWAATCLVYGALLAISERDPKLLLAGPSVMIMHFAWSSGFWQQLLAAGFRRRAA